MIGTDRANSEERMSREMGQNEGALPAEMIWQWLLKFSGQVLPNFAKGNFKNLKRK